MKHYIFTILATFIGSQTEAQDFDYPISQTKYIVSNAQLDDEGKNCIWSLKDAEVQSNPHKISYYISSSDSSLIIKEEYNTKSIYKTINHERSFVGMENKLTKITYDNGEIYTKQNLEFGDTLTGTFEGRGLYSDKIPLNIYGSYQTIVDGVGKLILKNNQKIENILKLTTIRQLNNNGKLISVKENRWLIPNQIFPVLERTEISCNNAIIGNITYYTPFDTHTEAKENKLTSIPKNSLSTQNKVASRIKSTKELFNYSSCKTDSNGNHSVSFDIYQNNISLSYIIYTFDGITIYSSDTYNYQKGHYTKRLPKLPPSNYIINFTANGRHYVKKVHF